MLTFVQKRKQLIASKCKTNFITNTEGITQHTIEWQYTRFKGFIDLGKETSLATYSVPSKLEV